MTVRMQRADSPLVPTDDLDAFPAELRAFDRAVGSDEHQGLPTGRTFDLRRRRVTVVITGGRVVRVRGRG